MKILFLYTELAEYFLSCVNELSQHADTEIHIVRWSVNKEAPFNFSFPDNVHVYERKEYDFNSLKNLALKISPDIIYVSGWIDKDYVRVCKQFRKSIPVLVGFDNQWKGTLKQHAATLVSRQVLLSIFTHCFVPGNRQIQFAKRLGFSEKNILTGLYTANVSLFSKYYEQFREEKEKYFPHRFIYVGRYLEFKGIEDLWQAFIQLQSESPSDWELWCLGTGAIKPIEYPKIKHFGFVQPKEMSKYIGEAGVFVLPSHFEPWGVVVQEFVAAGFPMICSDEVGAGDLFLSENKNGFKSKAGNIQSLKECMKRIIALSDTELVTMGDKSVELALQLTPQKWSDTLISVVKQYVRN